MYNLLKEKTKEIIKRIEESPIEKCDHFDKQYFMTIFGTLLCDWKYDLGLGKILLLLDRILNSSLKKLLFDEVLCDPRFLIQTAAKSKHQNYHGGLIVHTAQVADIAYSLSLSEYAEKVDKDILIASSILHDYGKIFEYEEKNEGFEYTKFAEEIGHIPYSYSFFNRMAEKYNLNKELTDKISHCILAHHGRKEWSSPVEPKSIEAFIIHSADMISAKYL